MRVSFICDCYSGQYFIRYIVTTSISISKHPDRFTWDAARRLRARRPRWARWWGAVACRARRRRRVCRCCLRMPVAAAAPPGIPAGWRTTALQTIQTAHETSPVPNVVLPFWITHSITRKCLIKMLTRKIINVDSHLCSVEHVQLQRCKVCISTPRLHRIRVRQLAKYLINSL